MKIILTFLLIFSIFTSVSAQKYCIGKPKKFKQYKLEVTSDQGGFYSNAYTIEKNEIQLESSLTHSQFMTFDRMKFASVTQVRYGVYRKFELKVGYAYVQPKTTQADTGTYSQLLVGFKGGLFHLERKNFEWDVALSGSYFIENIARGGRVFPGGYYAMINNSLEFYQWVTLNVMAGFMQNLNRNTKLGLLSAELYVKPYESKVGFFAGIGGMYIESYLNAGVVITDNCNYMMHFSVMALDN
ncbi:MAG: hypothetical protein PVF73_00550, partial [Bacteroidales bacterium]